MSASTTTNASTTETPQSFELAKQKIARSLVFGGQLAAAIGPVLIVAAICRRISRG